MAIQIRGEGTGEVMPDRPSPLVPYPYQYCSFINGPFLVDVAGVVDVEASEGVMEDVFSVSVLQLLAHEGEEGSEVDLAG